MNPETQARMEKWWDSIWKSPTPRCGGQMIYPSPGDIIMDLNDEVRRIRTELEETKKRLRKAEDAMKSCLNFLDEEGDDRGLTTAHLESCDRVYDKGPYAEGLRCTCGASDREMCISAAPCMIRGYFQKYPDRATGVETNENTL